MKFTILVNPSLVIITIHLICLNHASEKRRSFFKKYINFTLFTPKLRYLPLGGGSWNLQFLVSLPYRCYIPNLVKIGPGVLEKKMLTHDPQRRTPTHSNRSPELLRWPKNYNIVNLCNLWKFYNDCCSRNIFIKALGNVLFNK